MTTRQAVEEIRNIVTGWREQARIHRENRSPSNRAYAQTVENLAGEIAVVLDALSPPRPAAPTHSLAAASDALTARFEAVEDALKTHGAGVEAWVPFVGEGQADMPHAPGVVSWELGYGRLNGAWGLQVRGVGELQTEMTRRPLTDCPRTTRVQAAFALPALQVALGKAEDDLRARVAGAIAVVDQWLDGTAPEPVDPRDIHD